MATASLSLADLTIINQGSPPVTRSIPLSSLITLPDFSGSPRASHPGQPVNFIGVSSVASAFAWTFGDGVGTSTLQNPSYAYPNTGTYTVVMTVTVLGSQIPVTKTNYITVSACLAGPVWSLVTSIRGGNTVYAGVAYDSVNGRFIALGYDKTSNTPYVATSPDGKTWTSATTQPSNGSSGAAPANVVSYGGASVISYGQNDRSISLDGGRTWVSTEATYAGIGGLNRNSLAGGAGYICGMQQFTTSVTRLNVSTQLISTAVSTSNGPYVVFDGSKFINTNQTTTSYSSDGGATWTAGGAFPAGLGTITASAGANGIALFFDGGGNIARTADGGQTWTLYTSAIGGIAANSALYAYGAFLVISRRGLSLYSSADGITWTLNTSIMPDYSTNTNWYIASDNNGNYVGVNQPDATAGTGVGKAEYGTC